MEREMSMLYERFTEEERLKSNQIKSYFSILATLKKNSAANSVAESESENEDIYK